MGEDGAIDGRRQMFGIVEQWWRSKGPEQQELRRQLSRDGVMNGLNHKEGVHDTGHGCGKPLGMAKSGLGGSASPGGQVAGALMGALTSELGSGGGNGGLAGLGSAFAGGQGGRPSAGSPGLGKFAGEALGGGALGGLVGGLLSNYGGGREEPPKAQAYASQGYTPQGNYKQNYTEVAHGGNQYAQAQYSETQLPGGGRQTDYQRFQQQSNEYGAVEGARFEQRTEARPTYGGGFEQTNERIYERPSGVVETETWREGRTAEGRHYHEAQPEWKREEERDSSEERKKHGKHHKKHHSGQEEFGFGGERRETFEERRHEREFETQPVYEAPRREFGGGFEEPRRFEEPRFEERRFEEPPPRQEYGGRDFGERRFEEPRFEEPRRQEYGGGGGGFGGGGAYGESGYGAPVPGGFGNEARWGEGGREEEVREEIAEERFEERAEEEFREERREEGGGGWFS